MPKSDRDALKFIAGCAFGLAVFAQAPIVWAAQPIDSVSQTKQDEEEEALTLSAEQVNLIRVYEVDLEEEPRVRIERDVLNEFLDEFGGRNGMPEGRDEIRDFLRAPGWQQLDLFFKMRARGYYEKAEIQDEPEPLSQWRRNIHRRYVQGYFFRHFGNLPIDAEIVYRETQVGEIPMFGRGRDEDTVAYTNFYILTQMTIDGIPVIDRQNPEESILLQWGLPREDARFDAPEDIEGWQPHFRDEDDPRFVEMVEWIQSLRSGNQGQAYGTNYAPPLTPAPDDAPDEEGDE